MKIRHTDHREEIKLEMTPMIDIVFQLLVFFILTFKVVAMEGDFNIKMPQAAQSQGAPDPDAIQPIKIQLTSDANGNLTNIYFKYIEERALGPDFGKLRAEAIQLVSPDAGPSASSEQLEVEIEADYNLDYKYAVDAMTAVTGYRDDDGQIITLIEQVRFIPPTQ